MGCGSSKNKIHVSSTASPVDNTTVTSENGRKVTTPATRNSAKSRSESAKSKQSAWGSQDSLGGRGSVDHRGGSATSKISKHSMDSGFDDKDYARVITEGSDPNKVREVEEEFETPRELDLGLVGQPCKQRLSAKDKDRMEEQRVMATLQQEGLIARPMSRAGHGVRFDIVSADGGLDMFGAAKRPPPRLAKLEKRRKKKKQLSEQDIEEKLARAEERRKELEQQRLAKIQSVSMKSDVQNALDSFAQRQKEIVTDVQTKEDIALENRMKKLNQMRDKLKAKQEHAEAVRKRKMLAPIQTEADDEIRSHQRITEDTPIVSRQEY